MKNTFFTSAKKLNKLLYLFQVKYNRDIQIQKDARYERVMTDITTIDCLPNEIIVEIFDNLTVVDLARIERVCKHWRELANFSWDHVKVLNLYPKALGYQNTYPLTTPLGTISYGFIREILIRCGR